MKIIYSKYTGLILLIFLFAGCTTSALFNQRAYEQATSLKVDALSILDNASSPYDSCRTTVELLKLNVEKAYEYARGLPHNEFTVRQWEILIDTSGHSLFGILTRWKNENKLSRGFIIGAKSLVSDGFDTIIDLESGKPKESNY